MEFFNEEMKRPHWRAHVHFVDLLFQKTTGKIESLDQENLERKFEDDYTMILPTLINEKQKVERSNKKFLLDILIRYMTPSKLL